jgi:hypothetical protein
LILQRSIEDAPTLPVYSNLRDRFTGKAAEELKLKGGDPGWLYLQTRYWTRIMR